MVNAQTIEEQQVLRLDLGCGKNKKAGFIGVDVRHFDGVDEVADLRNRWPWNDESVEEIHCSHFLEHLTGEERIHFFNELYRVLKKGAKAQIIVPNWKSGRAYGDLTHQWPPVVEMFWYYLDRKWREENAPHVPLNCDFAASWGYAIQHPWNLKTQEAQMFALNHYHEVAADMIATLQARK